MRLAAFGVFERHRGRRDPRELRIGDSLWWEFIGVEGDFDGGRARVDSEDGPGHFGRNCRARAPQRKVLYLHMFLFSMREQLVFDSS